MAKTGVPIARDPFGRVFGCIYCSQRCSSIGVLTSHERDCRMRAIREREWKAERFRHGRRLGGQHRSGRWKSD